MRGKASVRGWAQMGILGAVVVVAMLLGGLLVTAVGKDDTPAAALAPAAEGSRALPVANQGTPPADGGAAATAALPNLPDLVERVRPAVVAIDTVVTARRSRQGQGLGTGVVIDRQGHILTNFHVVEGADQVTVELADGTTARAQVVGSDPGNDLAVVKVSLPAGVLTPARFANSDAIRLGEPVFAIGNPFNLKYTVTSGIVSGTERESRGGISGRPLRGVIQTDAAVNPGNSGGPLFNASGEVIGINSSIENPTGQRVFVGVGFAIPANTVQRFLPDMIAGRAITHPQLGVSGVTLTESNAKDAGVDVQKGVYITTVAAGSAADRAGLRAASVQDGGALLTGGDVVLAINGKEVSTIQQLARLVDSYKVGEQVRLTIIRGGKQMELTVALQEWTG